MRCTCTPFLQHTIYCDTRKRDVGELAKKIDALNAIEHELESKTDAELAELLMVHVWAEESALHARSVLLEVVIERLRRRAA